MSKIIYQPKGAALEYGDRALNHYKSCSHGCLYCYAPPCLHKKREDFHQEVDTAKDWLKRTKKTLSRCKGMEKKALSTCASHQIPINLLKRR